MITQKRKTEAGEFKAIGEGLFVLDKNKSHKFSIDLEYTTLVLNVELGAKYFFKQHQKASKGDSMINIDIHTYRNKKEAFTLSMDKFYFSFMFYRNFIMYIIEEKIT